MTDKGSHFGRHNQLVQIICEIMNFLEESSFIVQFKIGYKSKCLVAIFALSKMHHFAFLKMSKFSKCGLITWTFLFLLQIVLIFVRSTSRILVS